VHRDRPRPIARCSRSHVHRTLDAVQAQILVAVDEFHRFQAALRVTEVARGAVFDENPAHSERSRSSGIRPVEQ